MRDSCNSITNPGFPEAAGRKPSGFFVVYALKTKRLGVSLQS